MLLPTADAFKVDKDLPTCANDLIENEDPISLCSATLHAPPIRIFPIMETLEAMRANDRNERELLACS